jgi:hypothetical protein
LVASPNLDVKDLNITTLKQPSASVNPTNQKESTTLGTNTSGLKAGIILGKATIKSLLKPLFITAFKATSYKIPLFVR